MTEQEHNDEQCTMNNVQWRKVKLEEVAKTFTGLTYSPNCIDKSGTLVLRSSNIKDGQLCFEDNVFVSMDIPERAIVQENDILICVRNGSRNLIGKCALITKDAVGMAFGAFMTVLRTNIIDPKLLLYIWQSNNIQRQVANNIGATINQITNADFNRFEISYPESLPAQRRIAAILTSADKVIAATQKTIAKYKQIKQGMMEDLLNEQCTMNNVQWRKVKLGEVGDFYVGGDVDRSCFSPYPTVECRFPIYANALVNEGLYGFSSKYEFDKEAITITGRGDVGKVFYRKPYFSTIIRLVTLIPTDSNIDVKFLSYAMSRINFIIESTGVPQLTAPQAKKYEVSIPYKNGKPDLPAQRRIAAILSGIDAKIAAEEKVLEKYEKVKKGLMERLLNDNK